MNKIVRIGTVREGSMFARIEYDKGKLSISGVIGPMASGNARGGAGQFIMSFKEYDERGHMTLADVTPAPGWTPELVRQFFDTWDRWHLNDMRAGCQHQVGLEWDASRHPSGLLGKPCAVCGYKYGTAWLKEEVPADVLEFLRALPDTDVKPAWV